MATGMSTYLANQLLDAVCNADAFSVGTFYIKLHTADPGAAGTANAATETTRKAVSFSAAGSSVITNDADVIWTSVAGTEDFTHWSAWDALSGGNFLWSGTITSDAVTAGDPFVIHPGDLDLTWSPVAA